MKLPWRRPPLEHKVEIHDVRPLPEERDPWEPYFVALCGCDAVPVVRSTESEARRDGEEHARSTGGVVDPVLHRPVG